jgi:hypothetical protein
VAPANLPVEAVLVAQETRAKRPVTPSKKRIWLNVCFISKNGSLELPDFGRTTK